MTAVRNGCSTRKQPTISTPSPASVSSWSIRVGAFFGALGMGQRAAAAVHHRGPYGDCGAEWYRGRQRAARASSASHAPASRKGPPDRSARLLM